MQAEYKDLKDKKVVVTGAARGIGKSIAKAFLNQGTKTILISKSPVDWTVEYDDNQFINITGDIQDIDYFKTWLKNYEKDGSKIDILVNNAGIIQDSKLTDVTNNQWDEVMNTNCKATFFLTQLFASHMKTNNCGNIIFSTSFAALFPSYKYGIYAASKAATLSLAKSYAAELAPHNIRVNSFSPGVIETNMTKKSRTNNAKKMLNAISLNRFGSSDEVAQVVLFLASKESSYIHGANIDVSGGKFVIQNSDSIF